MLDFIFAFGCFWFTVVLDHAIIDIEAVDAVVPLFSKNGSSRNFAGPKVYVVGASCSPSNG